jgi:hypothetical protein
VTETLHCGNCCTRFEAEEGETATLARCAYCGYYGPHQTEADWQAARADDLYEQHREER